MKILFNNAGNQEILNRIITNTPQSEAKYGKINVSQILAHWQQTLLVAYSDLKLKREPVAVLFGSIFKNKLTTNEAPIGLNMSLLGSDGIVKATHPFSGTMTPNERNIIQWKHLDYYINQFGA